MNDNQTYDHIEDYLNGDLPETERVLFEKQIASDPELSSMVEKHKLANTLIVERRLMNVKALLSEQHTHNTTRFTNNRTLLISGIIASAALIGSAVYYLSQNNHNTEMLPRSLPGKAAQSNTTVESVQTQEPAQKSRIKQYNNIYLTTQPSEHSSLTREDSTVHSNDLSALRDSSIQRTVNIAAQTGNSVNGKIVLPCEGVSIQADIRSIPSCDDAENGSIIVSDIGGGKKPYSVQIKNSRNESVYNTQLSKGMYSVFIQDADQCHTNYQYIEVKQKVCEKDYAFNPFMGEVWKIPSGNTSGKLIMYEKSGAIFYEQEISAGYESEWNGEGKNNRLETGYYIFEIKYADGTSVKGSVTIVR